MILDQLITGALAFLLGGGAAQLITAWRESKSRGEEVKLLGAKTDVEVTDMAMSTLVKINVQLKEDYARVLAERDTYYERFHYLRQEVTALQDKLDKAQDDLRAAHRATSELQVQLEELMKTLPRREDEYGESTSRVPD